MPVTQQDYSDISRIRLLAKENHVWRRRAVRLAFFMLLLGIWQMIASLELWSEVIFPPPKQVADAIVFGFRDGSLPAAIQSSLQRLCIGYGTSLAIGIPVGLMLGRKPLLDDTIGSLSIGLQSLPSICWLPLAVLWFGLNETAMQFVIVMGSLMSIVLAVRDGVKSIPVLYIRAAHILGATGWRLYRHVLFPASLPSIMTGAKLGWSFAWRSLMAAELLYVASGIGSTLMTGRELHDMALVVAAMLIIIMIGLVTDRLIFKLGEDFVYRRWGVGGRG
jgi:NitT/TauT family transport system permease protein